MLNHLPYYLANSLFFTLIIEIAVAFLIKIRKPKDILNVGLVNVLTNPIVVSSTFLTGFFFGNDARTAAIIILEIAVLIGEALIYGKTLSSKRINPFLISLILNVASYFSGEILNRLIY